MLKTFPASNDVVSTLCVASFWRLNNVLSTLKRCRLRVLFSSYFYNQGNVLDGVLEYQKVLSKPIGNSGTNYVTFTPLYLDGSGLGMMTTVSTGVFARTNTSRTDLHDGRTVCRNILVLYLCWCMIISPK